MRKHAKSWILEKNHCRQMKKKTIAASTVLTENSRWSMSVVVRLGLSSWLILASSLDSTTSSTSPENEHSACTEVFSTMAQQVLRMTYCPEAKFGLDPGRRKKFGMRVEVCTSSCWLHFWSLSSIASETKATENVVFFQHLSLPCRWIF